VRNIRCDLWPSTVFPPASGWSSIIYKWLFTFFIATNALSTAWKVCGAMRRCCSGNRCQALRQKSRRVTGVTRRTQSECLAATSWLAPVTAEVESWENPVGQALEAVSRPAIRLQKSASSSLRCPGPLPARHTRGSRG